MEDFTLTKADREQLADLGIKESQLKKQMEIFQKASFQLHLLETCTIENGIHRMTSEEKEKYLKIHGSAAQQGRFLKFVPASGAATRMFRDLFKTKEEYPALRREDIEPAAQESDPSAQLFLKFIDNLGNFAFYEDLKEMMAKHGQRLDTCLQEGRYQQILKYLLGDHALNYGALPKGLLKFHRYDSQNRTAFEEHLVEAAHYVVDKDGICRLHFTISPEHEEKFVAFLEQVRPIYEKHFDVRFKMDLSFQKHSTDTIAVDLNNRPIRDSEGRLMFRPAGHGALLENLNDLKQDLVYLKNIDNVVPDHLKEPTVFWKKVLGGYLVAIQEKIHNCIRRLETSDTHDLQQQVKAVTDFVRGTLAMEFPSSFEEGSAESKRNFLLAKLNRPIRVCGVVPNTGEPGGAPFWVEEKDGSRSLQIVEKAQVDLTSPDQESIWSSSTHFNPVDIVCALRDHTGKSFDLTQYTNPEAVFISKKSSGGRDLKALELPGLWNGAMADWVSLFVEVPQVTFNPVKTVSDLLRPEHQPA